LSGRRDSTDRRLVGLVDELFDGGIVVGAEVAAASEFLDLLRAGDDPWCGFPGVGDHVEVTGVQHGQAGRCFEGSGDAESAEGLLHDEADVLAVSVPGAVSAPELAHAPVPCVSAKGPRSVGI
jgi:hypothetical protein